MQFLLTFSELFYGCFHGGGEGNGCSRNASIASPATQRAELWSCTLARLMVWWLTSCAATRAPSWECCREYPCWAQLQWLIQHLPLHPFPCMPNYQIFFLSVSWVTVIICIVSLPAARHAEIKQWTLPSFLNFVLNKVTLLRTSLRMGIVNLLPSLALRKLLKASGSSQITKAIKYFRN